MEIFAAKGQELVFGNRPVAMLKTNRGLIAMVEYHGGLGVGTADTSYSKSFHGLNALIGYQLNRSFIIAFGTGVSVYNGGALMPIYGDMRYTFLLDKIAPYLYGDAGLILSFYDLNKTRIFLNPGMGARYSLSRRFALNIAAGIFIQSGTSGAGQDAFVNLRTGVTYKF